MARALIVVAVVFAPLAVVGGCFSLDGFSGGSTTPDASSSNDAPVAPIEAAAVETSTPPIEDAGVDAADAADASVCPSGRGPQMVRINAPNASFCIDSTEVTNAQYHAFIEAAPAVTQIPACAFSTSLMPSNTTIYNDITKQNYPVANVNWCQASAFCSWANKRLCGKVGGGTIPAGDLAASVVSETFIVCTHAGTQIYPYGTTYDSAACNAIGQGMLEAVANRSSCEGGYPGVFDLIGNVGEWGDNCTATAGANDACSCNASSFEYTGGDASIADRCDHFDNAVRSNTYDDLGFRCCSN